MSGNGGWGSGLWKDLQKVRITDGTIEAPVTADSDGIRIGSVPVAPASEPKPGRRGLLSRLFRRGRAAG